MAAKKQVVPNQLGLFGSTSVEEKPKFSESQFWVATSSLQKFIRRGMADHAVDMARVMWVRPPNVRRRLMTIMMEDIGLGDWDRMVRCGDSMATTRATFEDVEREVRSLATAVKNRDTDDGFHLVTRARRGGNVGGTFPNQAEFDWLVKHSGHTDPGFVSSHWWELTEHEAEQRSKECLERVKWLRSFSSRGSAWHCSNLALLTIVRWDLDTNSLREPLGIRTDDEITQFEWLDEEKRFPEFGIDGHTRPGKVAYGKAQRDHGLDGDAMHGWFFFREGARLDRWAFWENDFRTLVVERCFVGPTPANVQEAVNDVKILRKWAWGKFVMNELK